MVTRSNTGLTTAASAVGAPSVVVLDPATAAIAAGANLYLEKPFSLKSLHAGVAKVLGG